MANKKVKKYKRIYDRKILRNWLKIQYRKNTIKQLWKHKDEIIPEHL